LHLEVLGFDGLFLNGVLLLQIREIFLELSPEVVESSAENDERRIH
jgi:hypothetical protein